MIVKNIEEVLIYESPDGGKTVYSRKSGSSEREMVKEDNTQNVVTRWYEWRNILRLAETEPTLADVINKAEVVYALIKKEKN
jgi:hypothetical protein